MSAPELTITHEPAPHELVAFFAQSADGTAAQPQAVHVHETYQAAHDGKLSPVALRVSGQIVGLALTEAAPDATTVNVRYLAAACLEDGEIIVGAIARRYPDARTLSSTFWRADNEGQEKALAGLGFRTTAVLDNLSPNAQVYMSRSLQPRPGSAASPLTHPGA